MLYAIDFLCTAPTPPAALLRRKLQTTTTRKSKKKLLQLKMYLLWPKVLRQRRSGRERDGKLSCTANGQRLVNCAKGSNNNSRCVCVCVQKQSLKMHSHFAARGKNYSTCGWGRRSEGGGLLKFNERSKAVRNHKTSRWLWAWHTHTLAHTHGRADCE